MSTSRQVIAICSGIGICIVVVTPFVFAINRFDWGVGLMLLAPLLIWLLMRIGTALERWARNEQKTSPSDPDFPDEVN